MIMIKWILTIALMMSGVGCSVVASPADKVQEPVVPKPEHHCEVCDRCK